MAADNAVSADERAAAEQAAAEAAAAREAAAAEERVRMVLEAAFLAEASGEAPDLATLCDGDPRLLERIIRLLNSEPELGRSITLDATRPDVAGTIEPIEALDDYELIATLGQGATGTVYLAHQKSLSRDVALKVLERMALRDPRTRIRFRRETELAASLGHPNIVPVYAVGEADGRGFLSMKRLSGPALDKLPEALDDREAAAVGAAIARALEAAHLAGIVHRDIKPANIILDEGVPHIVDFGLARSQSDRSQTHEGTAPGTLPYMAPELLRSGGAVFDPRLDVYSLGATLYELLAGAPPFEAADPELLVHQILFEEPARLRHVARNLDTIVRRALEKQPARRYASAADMAADLQAFHDGLPIASRRVGSLRRLARVARRRPRTASALVALSLVLGGLGGRQAFDRARRLARVESERVAAEIALGTLDLRAAERSVANLRALVGEDDSLALDLASRLQGEQAVDELLDLLGENAERIDPELLEQLVTSIVERDRLRHRPRLARLALALANWHLGRPERALARLDELRASDGASRAESALRSLVQGAEWTLVAATGELPTDERVLVAHALRLAGRPLEEQRAELSAALERDPHQRRARAALALVIADAGDLELARHLLTGLVRHEGTEAVVWRHLAAIHTRQGDTAAARAALLQLADPGWTPADASLNLRILMAEGLAETDPAAFESELAQQRQRWPGSSLLLRAEAEYEGFVKGHPDDALPLFELALEAAVSPHQRDMLAARRHELRADHVQPPGQPLDAPDEERVATLVRQGSDLLSTLTTPWAQAIVLRTQGRLLAVHLGRMTEGLAAQRRAVELAPDHVDARTDFVLTLMQRFDRSAPGDEKHYLAGEVRAQLEGLRDVLARGHRQLPDELLSRLHDARLKTHEHQNDLRALGRMPPEELLTADGALAREIIRRARAAEVAIFGEDVEP